MTLYEFNLLDEMEQAEAVWSGVHIGERKDEEFDILLYQVDSFYVEVLYDRKYNVIRKMRSFASTDQLQPYIGKIDLEGLIGKQ